MLSSSSPDHSTKVLNTLEQLMSLINNAKEKALVEGCNQTSKHFCLNIEVPLIQDDDVSQKVESKINIDYLFELGKDIRMRFQEILMLPFLFPELFMNPSIMSTAILLFGPHDMNKKLIMKKIAQQIKVMLFSFSITDLLLNYREEAEKIIKITFQAAKFYAPSIIFVNDLEAFETVTDQDSREVQRRCWTELVAQIDQTSREKNEPKTKIEVSEEDLIGEYVYFKRFYNKCEKDIQLPDQSARKKLFEAYLEDALVAQDIDFDYLIRQTEGYSPSDLANVCKESILGSQRRKILEMDLLQSNPNSEDVKKTLVIQSDFIKAIRTIHRSVPDVDLNDYDIWENQYANE